MSAITSAEVSENTKGVPTITAAPILAHDPPEVEDVSTHRTILVMKGCDGFTPQEIEYYQRAFDLMPDVGDDFLGFRLLSELGRGTFGRVFLAAQLELANRRVALKIAPDVGGESDRLARLQHTNIVPIHSVYLKGSLQALCMPYLGPNTLVNLIAELRRSRFGVKEPLPLIEQYFTARGLNEVDGILTIVSKLAEGLAHAHERKILHCDLKPANVLLSDDGQPMLLDFNLSLNALQVTTAAVGGTLPYMPPEQLQRYFNEGPGIDERSDLYSLGVILVEMLTGHELFETPVSPSVAEQVNRMIADRCGPIPQLKKWNPKVTPAVQSIVERLLAPDPEKRYRSADELREDLQRQLHRQRLVHAPDRSWREGWTKFRFRNPRLTSVVSIGLMAAGIFAALVGAILVREDRITRWEAREAARSLEDDRRELEFKLTEWTPFSRIDESLNFAATTRKRFAPELLTRLSDEEQQRSRQTLAEVLYFTASGHGLKAKQVASDEREDEIARAEAMLADLGSMTEKERLQRAVLMLQADLERTRGNEKEAQRLEKLANALKLETGLDLYLAAVGAYQKGDYVGAISHLEEARRRDPSQFHIWSLLGKCRSHKGEYKEAVTVFSACIAFRPDFYGSYYRRGEAYLLQSRPKEARDDFTEVIRLHPDIAGAYTNRSLTYTEDQEQKLAEADLTRAIELEPDNSRLYLLRARVRMRLKDLEGARDDRERGLDLTPVEPVEWVTRGLAQLPANPKAALADFDEAIRRDPRYLPAWNNRGVVLIRYLKRIDEAIESLSRAITFFPNDARPYAGRGVLLARKGKREEAIRDAEEALRIETSARNMYQVAGIYALTSKQHPEDASEAFRLLGTALRNGFGFEHLENDPDLEPIRLDPRFERTVREARKWKEAR